MPLESYQARNYGWRSFLTGDLVSRFPTAETTGWAHTDTTLTPYVGTHFFDVDAVIEDKVIDKDLLIVVAGAELTIRRCEILSAVDVSGGALLLMEDVKVIAGNVSNPAVGYDNFTLRRCDISGGQHSIMGGTNVLVEDCYTHDQYNDPIVEGTHAYHNNAFISNGGAHVILRRNSLDCSTPVLPNGGGPTGVASIFGDFGPLEDYLFEENLFKFTTGSYTVSCGWNPGKPFGDDPTEIVFQDNWFERGSSGRGGVYGPATSYKFIEPTFEWDNNRWLNDGTLVVPA
jgi:hypothetical protein